MIVNRKQILNSLLETIENISDKEFQERVWIRIEGPEVNDYNETVCFFFDDVDLILQQHKEFHLTKEQYILLLKFRKAFEIFDNENDYEDFPKLFIYTPEWQKIMDMAKDVLRAFNHITTMDKIKKLIFQWKHAFEGLISTVFTKTKKKSVPSTLLKQLSEISDQNYQQTVWMNKEDPKIENFREIASRFFEVSDSILKEHEKYLTEEQYVLLLKLSVELEWFRNNLHWNEKFCEFIDSPEWKKIMDRAKEVLAAFNHQG